MRQHGGIFILASEQKICVSKLPIKPRLIAFETNVPFVNVPLGALFLCGVRPFSQTVFCSIYV